MKKTLVPVTALALAMASATWAVMQASWIGVQAIGSFDAPHETYSSIVTRK
ncbi:MAG: hypothetical protein M3436_12440 [Pseudomonadota bacterium]|nr:hypothetical protein [Pseudomonadota bacterium]